MQREKNFFYKRRDRVTEMFSPLKSFFARRDRYVTLRMVNSGGLRLILFLLYFAPTLALAAIFGADTRVPTSSGATAVAVLSTNFSADSNGHLALEVDPLDGTICHDEKFSRDPSLSYACTGFLVAPDLIVTAGHCMVNTGQSRNQQKTFCEAFSWLFDYQNLSDGSVTLTDIPADKMYGCKEIIYAVRDEAPPYRDFAIVKLSRAVKDREPLKISAAPIRPGDKVSMIGYPLGTPAKLSSDARVLLNIESSQSFITNLDAFEGNSGSPVFNEKNEVIGILTGGTPVAPLHQDVHLTCARYNRCDDNGSNCEVPDEDTTLIPDFQITGSIVQRIGPVLEIIKRPNIWAKMRISTTLKYSASPLERGHNKFNRSSLADVH